MYNAVMTKVVRNSFGTLKSKLNNWCEILSIHGLSRGIKTFVAMVIHGVTGCGF
jgi:hypothetical protein